MVCRRYSQWLPAAIDDVAFAAALRSREGRVMSGGVTVETGKKKKEKEKKKKNGDPRLSAGGDQGVKRFECFERSNVSNVSNVSNMGVQDVPLQSVCVI
jgi:hypothetical protein